MELTIPVLSIENALFWGSECGGGATAVGAGAGAGCPFGTTPWTAFWPALVKLAGLLGVMGVAGVGTSVSVGASAAGVAPALRFEFDFFCVAACFDHN